MQKTITTFVARVKQGFADRASGQTAEFIRGGNAALEISEREFTETTLSNALLELKQTQQELETISDQLLRAREQNRLQQQDIERINAARGDQRGMKQHTLNLLNKRWIQRLQTIAVALVESRQRLGMEPATQDERVEYVLKLIGKMLQEPYCDLTPEEQKVAVQFSQITPAEIFQRATKTKAPAHTPDVPLNVEQRQQLALLSEARGRRTKYEQMEDKALARLHTLITQPSQELWDAAQGNPILLEHLQKWNRVVGTLEWLKEAETA